MTDALIFLPIFMGLSAALTVVIADLLPLGKNTGAEAVTMPENRPAAA